MIFEAPAIRNDLRFEISDLRLWISDLRSQIFRSSRKCQISKLKFPSPTRESCKGSTKATPGLRELLLPSRGLHNMSCGVDSRSQTDKTVLLPSYPSKQRQDRREFPDRAPANKSRKRAPSLRYHRRFPALNVVVVARTGSVTSRKVLRVLLILSNPRHRARVRRLADRRQAPLSIAL